jgi:uncharacterized repeat protein (TIGR03803 family)
MSVVTTSRHALSLGAAVAMLAGCEGSQLSLSASPQGVVPQQSLGRQAYHIIHPFGRSAGDGTRPAADLIEIKGALYGTTVKGGSHNEGTVFSITTSGEETVLYSFGGPNDGRWPVAALLNVNGTLYGTTSGGGALGYGTVFKITPSGAETVLHSFGIDSRYHISNGSVPLAGLINVNGTLYGTTVHGGAHSCESGYYSCGTVFSITTSGTYKLLHSFGGHLDGHLDGSLPEAALLDVNGMLYGTTSQGGAINSNSGTLFSITPGGQYQIVYNFGTNQTDGSEPAAPLINVNGTLYGTTSANGSYRHGTVFGVTTEGVETESFSFGGSNGGGPLAGLKNVKGVLYGTTQSGGVNNLGTVFKFTRSGEETVVHSFAKGDGVNPVAGVIAVDGTLYGTTYGSSTYGAKRSFGNVYSLTP